MAFDDDDEFDFPTWLREFGHGNTAKVLGKRLAELVLAAEATGKKGKLTLTLDIASQGGIAEVRAHVKATKPEPGLLGGAYYVTPEGKLVSEDPRQLKLPGKIVDAPERPLKTIPFVDHSKPEKKGD
jgi:hypothetical protein